MKAAEHRDFDRSHLFLVRVWSNSGDAEAEWQGRVQHVVSGEAHSFGNWGTLIKLFLSRLCVEEAGTEMGLGTEPQVPD